MEKKDAVAGNVEKELEELKKIENENDRISVKITNTGGFFSIICC